MRPLEQTHIVQVLAPVEINGAARTTDYVSLKNYQHCTFLLCFGLETAGGDCDIAVRASDDVSGTHTADLATIKSRKSGAVGTSDAWAAEATVTDSKLDFVAAGDIIPDTDENKMVAIEVDAAAVKAASTTYGMDCVALYIPDPGQSTFLCVLAILSGPRYAGASMPTAITD